MLGKDYLYGTETASHSWDSGTCYSGGTCIILVANTALINDKAIIIGGTRRSTNSEMGGGCGFCYMAIGELLNE